MTKGKREFALAFLFGIIVSCTGTIPCPKPLKPRFRLFELYGAQGQHYYKNLYSVCDSNFFPAFKIADGKCG